MLFSANSQALNLIFFWNLIDFVLKYKLISIDFVTCSSYLIKLRGKLLSQSSHALFRQILNILSIFCHYRKYNDTNQNKHQTVVNILTCENPLHLFMCYTRGLKTWVTYPINWRINQAEILFIILKSWSIKPLFLSKSSGLHKWNIRAYTGSFMWSFFPFNYTGWAY